MNLLENLEVNRDTGEIKTKQGDYSSRFGQKRAPIVQKDIESVQSLHMLLRTTDFLLKLLYHEIAGVNHWSEGVNMRDKQFIKNAKLKVQSHMKDKTGIKVAYPDSTGNSGTTTTGNVAIRLLYEKDVRELLLELIENEGRRDMMRVIMVRTAVVLRVVSSSRKMTEAKVEELEAFCKETYRLLLESFPRPLCEMSPTIHKLLGHSWELIAMNGNYGLGTLSEGGIEASNKFLRRYRIQLARKRSQHDNLTDCARRLWLDSDPVLNAILTNNLPTCRKCQLKGHIYRYCPRRYDTALQQEDSLVESFLS